MAKISQAMIFCAGVGSRLRPITDTIPKPLVKICGKSILEYILENIIRYGIKHIVINTHYLPEQIDIFIAEYKRKLSSDITIRIVHEPELLGSGGGLKNAVSKGYLNQDEPVLAVNGDIIWLDNNKQVYQKLLSAWTNDKGMIILIQPKNLATGYYYAGDFDLGDNNIIRKGLEYICLGIHIIYPSLVLNYPKESFSLNELYYSEKVEGIVNDLEYWLHIGDIKGMEEAERFLISLGN